MLLTENLQNKETSVIDYGLVSIIMPSYNSEKYIEKTIQSVLAQTYQNWELLFVDDCSSDASIELIKSFKDDRIHIFFMKENSGAAVARNRAITEANGKWIAFFVQNDFKIMITIYKRLNCCWFIF